MVNLTQMQITQDKCPTAVKYMQMLYIASPSVVDCQVKLTVAGRYGGQNGESDF